MRLNYIDNCDCLEGMKNIPDGSVDLIVTDPPYGTMKGIDDRHDWDVAIPPEVLLPEFSRVLRRNGKAVIFGQEPYTSTLIKGVIPEMLFCYRGVWLKNSPGNARMSKTAMVSLYEDFCVFINKETHGGLHKKTSKITEMVMNMGFDEFALIMYGEGRYKNLSSAKIATHKKIHIDGWNDYDSNPFDEKMYRYLETQVEMPYTFDEYFSIVAEYKEKTKSVFNLWQGGKSKPNVLRYPKDPKPVHPTQKPVALIEDLIQTFSNPGAVVLDPFMGSGTTAVAALRTGRNFIGFELNETYHAIAQQRIADELDRLLTEEATPCK